MAKKYLRKNEFRLDYNKKHYGKNEKPHPAYISAKCGHKLKANSITHSKKTTDGFDTYKISENPNKTRVKYDKRITRISPPFWQNENLFGKEKLQNYRFSKKTRYQIKKINKGYK